MLMRPYLPATLAVFLFAFPAAAEQPPAPPTPAESAEPPVPPAEPAADPQAKEPTESAAQAETPLLDGALEALLRGDLDAAQLALDDAAFAATTPETRAAAALLADRLRALRARRAAGVPPPPTVPPLPATEPRAPSRPPFRLTVGDESARTALLVTTTVLGLGVWGWTLPIALDLDLGQSPRTFLGLYMVSAAGAFVGPYLGTRTAPPTWSQANLAFYGGTRGLEYGVLVSNLLLGHRGGNLFEGPGRGQERALATSVLLGSMGGLWGGYFWADAAAMTPGQARTTALMGDFGLLFGFGMGHVLGLDQQDRPFEQRNADTQARSMAAAGLTGTIAGLAGGRLLGRRRDNSWGDGEVMRASGVLGTWTAGTLTVLAEAKRSKAIVGTLMLGAAGGLVAGDYLVRDTNFTFGQSIIVDLAMVAGGLGGAGLTYLLSKAESPKPYFVTSTLGAGLGFGLAYVAYRGQGDGGAGHAGGAVPPLRLALVPQLGAQGHRGLGVAGSF
jgi:hypothetical protein